MLFQKLFQKFFANLILPYLRYLHNLVSQTQAVFNLLFLLQVHIIRGV
jgi:hypothetical protein